MDPFKNANLKIQYGKNIKIIENLKNHDLTQCWTSDIMVHGITGKEWVKSVFHQKWQKLSLLLYYIIL